MSQYDHMLGIEINKMLIAKGIETPRGMPYSGVPFDAIRISQEMTMKALGLDLHDDSLAKTPERVAKMYCQEIFDGLNYNLFPKCTTVENKAKVDEMITVTKVDVMSMCEHHFVPFIGNAHVAYIPGTKILGLSKINRVVEFFARRPQIQERLTEQVYAALTHILATEDVAVVIQAQHLCVKMRGVKHGATSTTTSKMGGRFMAKPEARAEFMSLIGSEK